MDVKTLDSAEQTRAAIEVFTLMRTTLETVRRGDRKDLARVALLEVDRCDKELEQLERHLKRFGRRNHIAA